MVTYTYESWLSLQRSRKQRLDGKQRWLDIVKSDAELVELSGSALEIIRHRAQEILNEFNTEHETQAGSNADKPNAKRKSNASNNASLITRLFIAYNATDELLSRCAIAHLIKNGGKIPEVEEDLEKFAHRVHRKQKEIEELEAQLQARLPKGRDLTGEEFLETLAIATQQISESVAQAREWQAKLLTRPASLPYPIIYDGSNVRWDKTEKER
jgi:hypothetical protein